MDRSNGQLNSSSEFIILDNPDQVFNDYPYEEEYLSFSRLEASKNKKRIDELNRITWNRSVALYNKLNEKNQNISARVDQVETITEYNQLKELLLDNRRQQDEDFLEIREQVANLSEDAKQEIKRVLDGIDKKMEKIEARMSKTLTSVQNKLNSYETILEHTTNDTQNSYNRLKQEMDSLMFETNGKLKIYEKRFKAILKLVHHVLIDLDIVVFYEVEGEKKIKSEKVIVNTEIDNRNRNLTQFSKDIEFTNDNGRVIVYAIILGSKESILSVDLPEDAKDVHIVSRIMKVTPFLKREQDYFYNKCHICDDRMINALVKPCNHCAMCVSCAVHIQENMKKCPFCYTEIEDIEKIYLN